MDEIKEFHREQHRKNIEMYQGGVICGIRFAIDRLLAMLDDNIRTELVDSLLKEYNDQ